MPFVTMPGVVGKIYVPDEKPVLRRRHACKDCFSCQMCGEDRCQLCRAEKESEKAPDAKRPFPVV